MEMQVDYKDMHQIQIKDKDGTQISGGNGSNSGQFGIGGYGSSNANGGGGGGYYGGGASTNGRDYGGGGGSSYISGHIGCIAITSATDLTPKTQTYSDISDSYHYSGLVFRNTKMIDGRGWKWITTEEGESAEMPNYNGGIMTANSGNGYARVTRLY